MTLPFIGEERVGLLGICAGGGYAINAALTEHRFKAIGTVVANARGGVPRRDPWIPDTLRGAEAAGITDPEVLEAVTFYRESRYRHPNSTNRLLFTSYGHLLNFHAFNLVPELLTQPLQVIVAGKRGNTGQYEAEQRLIELSRAAEKDFFVVEGAGHYDMYYQPGYVNPAIDRLVRFYSKHIGV